jgi:hypothetical protein
MDKITKHALCQICETLISIGQALPLAVDIDSLSHTLAAVKKAKVHTGGGKTGGKVDRKSLVEVMEHFKEQWGGKDMPAFNKVYWPRNMKPAKELLLLTGGDVPKAKRAVDMVRAELSRKQIPWNMNTVVKMFSRIEHKVESGEDVL